MTQNQDFIKDVLVKAIPTVTNTNSHNTNNNQFNINMFLNEQCKNAMNISATRRDGSAEISDVIWFERHSGEGGREDEVER